MHLFLYFWIVFFVLHFLWSVTHLADLLILTRLICFLLYTSFTQILAFVKLHVLRNTVFCNFWLNVISFLYRTSRSFVDWACTFNLIVHNPELRMLSRKTKMVEIEHDLQDMFCLTCIRLILIRRWLSLTCTGLSLTCIWSSMSCTWLSLICKWSSLICRWSSLICKWSSLICRWSNLICKWSSLICIWSSLICKWSSLICKWSNLIYRWSSLICKWSNLICRWSSLIYKWSSLICRRSNLICKWSSFICKWSSLICKWSNLTSIWLFCWSSYTVYGWVLSTFYIQYNWVWILC